MRTQQQGTRWAICGRIRYLKAIVAQGDQFDRQLKIAKTPIEQELFKVAAAQRVDGFDNRGIRFSGAPVVVFAATAGSEAGTA